MSALQTLYSKNKILLYLKLLFGLAKKITRLWENISTDSRLLNAPSHIKIPITFRF